MIKVFHLFEKYILEKLPQITFVSLTVVFFINAFYNIALLDDGTWDFLNILNNIFWSNENRNYATFIVNLPMILAIKFGSTDFNLFIIMQGFWFFFVLLICLFIVYINIPKEHKNMFQFVLLAYLISMNFVGAYFSNKSFICAGLYWIIATIFIFEKFNTISFKKIFLLLICAFALIKNYQWSAIFALILFFYMLVFIKKIDFNKNRNQKIIKILLFLILAILFLLTPVWVAKTYTEHSLHFMAISVSPIYEFFSNPKIIHFLSAILLIALIIFFSFIKKYNNFKKILLFLIFICFLAIFANYNFLYAIEGYRILNFFIPLICSCILFFVYKKKLFVNFRIIKILNLILLVFFIVNIVVITQKFNHKLNDIYGYIQKKEGLIKLLKINDSNLILQGTFRSEQLLHNSYRLHPWLSIILQKQNKNSNINSLFYIIDENDYNFNFALSMETLPNLEKFGITYSDELLKKIEENSKLHSKINKKFI